MTARLWAIIAVVGVVALGAGVGIGAATWAGGDHGDNDAMASDSEHGEMPAHGSATSPPLDEQAFLEQMIPHHESAVAMATIALEKTERPQIRRLAGQIAASQEGEIARMQSWHKAWFGVEVMPDMAGPHGSMDLDPLADLSGDEFDRAFLAMMIPHHASAITMAESVMMGSPRDDVARLADEIIAAQATEIGQMQRWREQWFPRD
ncbi:MAG: DUF305 domain-containing protein [Thermoleophilia bacterium]